MAQPTFFRRQMTFAASLLSICLFTACSEGSAASANNNPPPSPAAESGWQIPFPGLDELKAVDYAMGDLRNTGSDFLPGYAQGLTTPVGNSAVFKPDYDASDSGSTRQAAYAVYGFELENYSLGIQVELEFSQTQDYGDLWLGLSDWQGKRWRWSDLSSSQSISFDAEVASDFINDGTNMLFAAVACTGTGPWTLDAISIARIGQQDYPNQGALLGMNLAGVPDWGRAWVFVDVFKHARDWISQPSDNSTWSDGRNIPVDQNGWPTSLLADQFAGNVLLTGQDGNYPTGDYICLYDGVGTLDFRLDASIVSQEPGRIVVHITPEGTGLTHLQITSTNPTDPLRNIRLVMPGYENTYAEQIFHPEFLSSLQYYSVLRFMDFMETNGSNNQLWADRTTPERFSQAGQGVCIEYMVELCNRVGSDAWFCMPHLADDEYIREFATYVRNNLDASLRVYIEYSNEVWNGQFAQAEHARQRGLELELSTNDNQARLFYHSRRSVEIFTIWEEVFGGTERLVRVLGVQHVSSWGIEQVLNFEDAYLHADAMATAPYFGGSLGSPANAEATKAMSFAEVLAACDAASIANAAITTFNHDYATNRGLDLITYEGGQHLVGTGGMENDDVLTAHLQAVNRDPGMRQVYIDDLARWSSNGGGLFCAFSHISRFSKWGSWGLMEFQEQEPQDSPKFLGLLDYAGLVP